MLPEIVRDKLDILLISKTKVNPSFSSNQFAIESFCSLFDMTEIVQEVVLRYLLEKKFLQNSSVIQTKLKIYL